MALDYDHQIIDAEKTFASLLSPWASELDATTAKHSQRPVLIVLDDDPTGTQTVHDIIVLTVWDIPAITQELKSGAPGFFILTNSRAFPADQARTLIKEICRNIKTAAQETSIEVEIVLRSDSTLRGHFPLEPEVAEEVFGVRDAWIVAPFFFEGGRFTINDIHYVKMGSELVPAAMTPFAKDASFGFQNSNLKDFVVEKAAGKFVPEDITSISLEDLRKGGPDAVARILMSLGRAKVVVVNAAEIRDMDVFCAGLAIAESRGKRFLFRTAASFVSSRLQIKQILPIELRQIRSAESTGQGVLLVVGSYVPKTTAQIQHVLKARHEKLVVVDLSVQDLLAVSAGDIVSKAVADVDTGLLTGNEVVLMTSRELCTSGDEAENLRIGSTIMSALVEIVSNLSVRPRYVVAKGGITSADVARKGLRIRKATIIGQAGKGIPLWMSREQSDKFPGCPYVVFPGNVGEEDAITELLETWSE